MGRQVRRELGIAGPLGALLEAVALALVLVATAREVTRSLTACARSFARFWRNVGLAVERLAREGPPMRPTGSGSSSAS